MKNMQNYIDTARIRTQTKSDRLLGHNMGLSYATVGKWRVGKSYPNEDQMMKLAELAGVDKCQAMLDLAVWRAKDDVTAETWQKLSNIFNKAISDGKDKIGMVLAFGLIVPTGTTADASQTLALSPVTPNFIQALDSLQYILC